MNPRVLVVDDDHGMCEMLESRLTRRGFSVTTHTSGANAFELLAGHEGSEFAAVVTDLNMTGLSGVALCERIVANWPNIPVVVITAFGTLQTAIEAIRAGAYDFITKPIEIEALAHALRRAVEHHELREEVKHLRESTSSSTASRGLIGESETMKGLHDLIARAAQSDASVLVAGESGTGKELVARAIHRDSRRGGGPLVGINCAAVPAALLESELFGHERGAFTDAIRARKGLFLEASGGTLFLDEVTELPLELQPKLLRAIQERTVRPVGSDAEVPCDVRIVAATNRDLEACVEAGRFREDLYFRLNVIQLVVPPLRARGRDVLLLAQHFLERFAAREGRPVKGLSHGAAVKLLDYGWPGNVRELQNCLERAVALTRTEEIIVEDLPDRIRQYQRTDLLIPGNDPVTLPPMDEVERRYIFHVLEAVSGNKAMAARVLGFDRKTLYRKLDRYGSGS